MIPGPTSTKQIKLWLFFERTNRFIKKGFCFRNKSNRVNGRLEKMWLEERGGFFHFLRDSKFSRQVWNFSNVLIVLCLDVWDFLHREDGDSSFLSSVRKEESCSDLLCTLSLFGHNSFIFTAVDYKYIEIYIGTLNCIYGLSHLTLYRNIWNHIVQYA